MRSIYRANSSLSICLLVAAIVLAPAVAWANRAPPEVPDERTPLAKADGAPLAVVLQDGGAPLRIEIPRGLLPKEAKEKRAMPFGLGEFTTFVSGLFLSLALAAGGVWLARRLSGAGARRLSARATAVMVSLFLATGVAVAAALANAPVPPRSPPGDPLAPAKLTVQITIVDRGDAVLLHASPADLAKLAALLKPAPGETPAATRPNAPAK